MTLEAALMTELKGSTGLADLVSTRIHFLVLPQPTTYPAIRLQRISTPRYHAFGADPKLSSPRVQFDVFAETYGSAKGISEVLRGILQNFTGTMGSTSNSVSNVAVTIPDQSEHYEDDTKLYRVRTDFRIYHNEP